jgi:hypothetical protein
MNTSSLLSLAGITMIAPHVNAEAGLISGVLCVLISLFFSGNE